MVIEPEDFEETVKALYSAFNEDYMLDDLLQYGLYEKRNALVDVYKPLPVQIRQAVNALQTSGRTGELILKAYARKPGNPKMQALLGRLSSKGLSPHLTVADKMPGLLAQGLPLPELPAVDEDPTLQALIAKEGTWTSGARATKMVKDIYTACQRVCRVEGPLKGTGFLVGERHVIINYHVVRDSPAEQLEVVFDEVEGIRAGARAKVVEVPLRSPVHDYDFAILKLGAEFTNDGRGFYKPVSRSATYREVVYVAQHGGGLPVTIAGGVVGDINVLKRSIAYTANTQPGSSGSPVFDGDWNVIAIHHQGDEMHNHGVPMSSILKAYGDGLFSGLL